MIIQEITDMHKVRWRILVLAVAALLIGSSGFAQVGAPGTAGVGGGGERPKRKVHKSRAPVLSPSLTR